MCPHTSLIAEHKSTEIQNLDKTHIQISSKHVPLFHLIFQLLFQMRYLMFQFFYLVTKPVFGFCFRSFQYSLRQRKYFLLLLKSQGGGGEQKHYKLKDIGDYRIITNFYMKLGSMTFAKEVILTCYKLKHLFNRRKGKREKQ